MTAPFTRATRPLALAAVLGAALAWAPAMAAGAPGTTPEGSANPSVSHGPKNPALPQAPGAGDEASPPSAQAPTAPDATPDGVIPPPHTGDSNVLPPPDQGTAKTPVIPAPGTPGGDPDVTPQ